MVKKIVFSKHFLLLFFGMISFVSLQGGGYKDPNYVAYIQKYATLAQEQQKLYKIPASITLAQGLLESGAGKSRLAVRANNHFGIKCSNWNGMSIRHDDDRRGECFRMYKNVKESYKDHSEFLLRPRYEFLFDLQITDYKAWARGLKRAGYATSKTYATRLIEIIETYELYEYDVIKKEKKRKQDRVFEPEVAVEDLSHDESVPPVYLLNDVEYIRVEKGDNLESLAHRMNISVNKLADYNDVSLSYIPQKGERLFLEKKKKKAASGIYVHKVKRGETMHSISQNYAIRLESLYKHNKLAEDYRPQVGEILRLR